MTPARYAIYYVPPETAPWARFCTAWLGWDMVAGTEVPPPEVADLPCPAAELTETPRRYGLHATLKPPFRLASGRSAEELAAAAGALAARLPPLRLDGLALVPLGRFLALVPRGAPDTLADLAAACVRDLDGFRAPATAEELARRRGRGLTDAQEKNLRHWGYPYVMEEFRFHITLTGRLSAPRRAAVQSALAKALAPMLPAPFRIDDIALAAEGEDGRFRLCRRFTLSGRPRD